jgi:sterol desaturase/sphingolipid hydroxylase (fatty acid hydroxylase superfamily)
MRRLHRGGALWLGFVAFSIAAFGFGFSNGWGALTLFAVPAAQVSILLVLERLLPARREGRPRFWQDLGHNLVSNGVGTVLGDAYLLAGAAWCAALLSDSLGSGIWPSGGSLPVQVLAVVIAADGLEYARHRLAHTSPWLWPVHALHHTIDRLDVMKSGRGHAFDLLTRYAAVFVPLVLCGVPGELILAYPAAVTVFGPIAHANVDVPVADFFHRLVVTPQVHHLHHARSLELAQSNYSNVTPLWDLLFGTFADPRRHPSPAYGVEGGPDPQRFLGQLWLPFELWRGAGADLRSR